MALTAIQREVCRLLAENRVASGESYVAGAAALNELLNAPRLSGDVDLFHDTDEALDASWKSDRSVLEARGFEVQVLRERPFFVEARAVRDDGSLVMQWARDSAYRFFPLVRHDELGLVLHPFDLATNKVLALIGRLEVRDWVDVIHCGASLQPLGYLAWAACGKDPGFSPHAILQQAARSARYSAEEVLSLAFAGPPPNPATLAEEWHASLKEAGSSQFFRRWRPASASWPGKVDSSAATPRPELAMKKGALHFHPGSIRGVLPRLVDER